MWNDLNEVKRFLNEVSTDLDQLEYLKVGLGSKENFLVGTREQFADGRGVLVSEEDVKQIVGKEIGVLEEKIKRREEILTKILIAIRGEEIPLGIKVLAVAESDEVKAVEVAGLEAFPKEVP